MAKLPFTPLSYIQGLSHRNLLGDDSTDCSFIFLYILCTMSIRQVRGQGPGASAFQRTRDRAYSVGYHPASGVVSCRVWWPHLGLLRCPLRR